MRTAMKVRKVSDSIVITLTKEICQMAKLSIGDKVIIECSPSGRLTVYKKLEDEAHDDIEIEIDLLEKQRAHVESKRRRMDLEFKSKRRRNAEETDRYLLDNAVLVEQRSLIDTKIAEKRMQLRGNDSNNS
jgi:antitoxin component of MazEF toxin-antitoxin module